MTERLLDVIAIDGPAGAGKSTTARLVAERLNFTYLDTGAMYRALTLKILTLDIDITNKDQLNGLLSDTRIQLQQRGGRLNVLLDGKDVTRQIRSKAVSQAVANVAALKPVRDWMLKLQREAGAAGKIVAEGRDIGTVVFPDARLKIFLTASLEQRARRRKKEFSRRREPVDLAQVAQALQQRDLLDSTRANGPLRQAEDAIVLDTSNLTIEQQVDFVIDQWQRALSER
ncbi:MAG: (d)CMP kinase [candidate division KSB1 bacterium]|nr:(d)CMP kinase [candidate division KSB1 bacterium]MDZ7334269.1 (d)CMP kinase [candidate division KSB1 bacterium]MDZ7356333.1 (d)CMP kinase [candidate division KSB1 bacterium]MDZ7377176.1 (d)CMP kinase [candidate division KSB1 bacterium]MDZ7401025.1 (d)CMP kinase [candidate division KSB1 bacterium]